jgi:adenine-specific DNA-methyltransferase
VAGGRVTFGPRGDSVPRLKRFLAETRRGLVPTTWWPASEVGTTDSAKQHLRRLFPAVVPFETPKPEELVARVVQIATDPGDLVLDCHAGSGTTPAVAHKLRRRWFAVEREARTVSEFLVPRLDAVVAGADPGGATAAAGWHGGGDYGVRGLPEPLIGAA